MTERLGALVGLVLVASIGCAVQPPEGVFVCSSRSECPDGMDCVRERCRRPVDAGGVDAPRDTPVTDAPLDDTVVPPDAVDAPVTPCDSVLAIAAGTQIHSSGEDRSGNIVATGDALTLAMSYTGTFLTFPAVLFDGQIAALDRTDTVAAVGNVSGSGDSHVRAIVDTSDGIVAVGTTTLDTSFDATAPMNAVGLAGFVYRPSGVTGRLLQASSAGNRVEPTAITTRTDGLVCIGGFYDGSSNFGFGSDRIADALDGFVSCLDGDLSFARGRPLGGPGDQRVHAITSDGMGGLYVGGSFTGSLDTPEGMIMRVSPQDGFVVHLGPDLRLLESFTFGASRGSSVVRDVLAFDGAVYAVGELAPGTVAGALAGVMLGHSGSSIDALLVRLDMALVPVSAVAADQGEYDAFFAVDTDRCGRPVVAGGLGGATPGEPLGLIPVMRVYDAVGTSRFEAIADAVGGYFSGVVVDGDGRINLYGTYRSPLMISGEALPHALATDGPTELMVLRLF